MKTIWPTDLNNFEYWKRFGGVNRRLIKFLSQLKRRRPSTQTMTLHGQGTAVEHSTTFVTTTHKRSTRR